jgi:hypothetical protein
VLEDDIDIVNFDEEEGQQQLQDLLAVQQINVNGNTSF